MSIENDINAYANIKRRFDDFEPRVQSITLASGFQFDILRLDEIDPYISGNKWYKLKYNIAKALEEGTGTIITYGGAYSNHLVATAQAAHIFGLHCVCIIRGEAPVEFNARLTFIKETGASMHFIPRGAYALKEASTEVHNIFKQYGNYYIIPEGGANALGVKGCTDILKRVTATYDIIACAAGTGTMASGILQSAPDITPVYVFPAIKTSDLQPSETMLYKSIIDHAKQQAHQLHLITDYHFGGYARTNSTLNTFVEQFKEAYNVSIDRVYTGKMVYGIIDMLNKGCLKKDTRLLVIHSGGVFPGE